MEIKFVEESWQVNLKLYNVMFVLYLIGYLIIIKYKQYEVRECWFDICF